MTTIKRAFFAKNIAMWERVARAVAAALAAAAGGALGTPYRELGVVTAATLLVTGLIGFCPACAVLGRKLPVPPERR